MYWPHTTVQCNPPDIRTPQQASQSAPPERMSPHRRAPLMLLAWIRHRFCACATYFSSRKNNHFFRKKLIFHSVSNHICVRLIKLLLIARVDWCVTNQNQQSVTIAISCWHKVYISLRKVATTSSYENRSGYQMDLTFDMKNKGPIP